MNDAALAGSIIWLGAIVLGVIVVIAWVILPFTISSKLTEIHRTLKAIHAIEAAKWQERHAHTPPVLRKSTTS